MDPPFFCAFKQAEAAPTLSLALVFIGTFLLCPETLAKAPTRPTCIVYLLQTIKAVGKLPLVQEVVDRSRRRREDAERDFRKDQDDRKKELERRRDAATEKARLLRVAQEAEIERVRLLRVAQEAEAEKARLLQVAQEAERARLVAVRVAKIQRLDLAREAIRAWSKSFYAMSSHGPELMDQLKNRFLMRILQDPILIPRATAAKKGRVHIMGPGMNHYEWVVPLLARPDTEITVSEPSFFRGDLGDISIMSWDRYPLQKEAYFRSVYREVERNNPSLLFPLDASLSPVADLRAIENAPEQMISEDAFVARAMGITFLSRAEEAKTKADLVISIAPDADRGFSDEGGVARDPTVVIDRYKQITHANSIIWVIADGILNGNVWAKDFYAIGMSDPSRLNVWFGNNVWKPREASPGSYMGSPFATKPFLMIRKDETKDDN